jgi:hypothetical protein
MLWWREYKLGRLVVTALAAVWGIGFVLNRDTTMVSVLHHPALAIHEGGHYFVFAWAPEFLQVLGGSLTQCVLPFLFVVYFWRSGQRFAACITLFWVSFNLIDTAVYIADARARALPLLFGEDSIHDWNYLLSSLGWLNADEFIAGVVHAFGALCYAACVAGGVYFAKGDDRALLRRAPEDPALQPVARMRNIGARSAHLLHSIGVKTRADLVRLGALEVYRQLLERGAKPSLSLLYALHGAIVERDWNALGEKEKAYLKAEAEALETPKV